VKTFVARIGSLAVLLSALVLVAGSATAVEKRPGPSGLGKATFGMTIDQVKKIYPGMEEAKGSMGAPVVGGPYIKRFALHHQKVDGLPKPVDIELRFWKDKFWLYIVYIDGIDTAQVDKALTAAYGPVSNTDTAIGVWDGVKSAIVFERKNGRYSVNDNAMSKEASAWFVSLFRKHSSQPQTQAAKTPAPAAPAPAAKPPQ
jgi:hypothetical protein